MSFQDVVDLTVTACAIRGLFVPETYTTSWDLGDKMAEGIENEFGKGFVWGFTVGMTAGAISMINGGKAFVKDGQKLWKKLQEVEPPRVFSR